MPRIYLIALITLVSPISSPFFASVSQAQPDGGASSGGGPVVGNFTEIDIRKQTGAQSALDIYLDGTGNALRIFARGSKTAGTYFHDSGMLYTSGWVVISGTATPEGAIQLPTQDPSMLSVWSDIHGPAVQVRSALAGPESYIFQALDREGDYTFSVEQNGGLRWGDAARAAMDTNLYRDRPRSLKTDGSLAVAGRLAVGPASAGSTLSVDGSQSVKRVAVSADYAAGENDYYIGVTDTSRPRTVTLPSAVGKPGRVYVIKDESGRAGKNPVTVRARAGERIDGADAQAIRTNYGVLRVISGGKDWFLM